MNRFALEIFLIMVALFLSGTLGWKVRGRFDDRRQRAAIEAGLIASRAAGEGFLSGFKSARDLFSNQ